MPEGSAIKLPTEPAPVLHRAYTNRGSSRWRISDSCTQSSITPPPPTTTTTTTTTTTSSSSSSYYYYYYYNHITMSANMDWSPDYCLSCDRQISEGAYCSQACRLADLEKAKSPSQLSSSASSTGSSTNGFYLPPAVNFSAYKAPTPSRGFDTSYHYYPTNNGTYFAPAQSASARSSQPQQQQRSLTPSSSRSSLASSTSQTTGISAQAASQLNYYARNFDQVREIKRRMT